MGRNAYLAVIIVILLAVILLSYMKLAAINSFEECAAAGYPIMESYPRQCRTPDGRTFTENIGFCGTSTLGNCSVDSDCIRGGCSGQVCQSKYEEPVITTCEYRECYNPGPYKCECEDNKCGWNRS